LVPVGQVRGGSFSSWSLRREARAGVMGLGFYRGKHSKYNARPTRCRQGLMHHSAMEAKRCNELHLMQEGGLISDLEAHPQPRYRLDVEGVHICDYMADFAYYDIEQDRPVVEDVKGHATEVYRLKKKLMLACHGIAVDEVRRH